LIKQTGLQNSDLSIMAREFFGRLGINWDIPKGKTVFYNDDLNLLFVKATESDLDLLERALHLLNKDAPQLHITAWFFQVPKGTLDAFSKTIHGTNKIPAELTGILTSQNFKTILQSLEARTNVETLAEPEGVTTSGREMQMRATQKITIVGSASFTQNYLVPRISSNSMSSITFNEQTLETGPVFDSVASVLSYNLTIDLNVTTSLTNFFGYTDQSHITQVNFDTNSVSLPDIHPVVRIQTASAHVKLYDGQTLVLGKFQTESSGSENFPKNKNKELLVFVTVVIVDPAGNRVHSDDEMPFYTNGIPPADSSVNLHL
jgi:Flp pilus assembly secretin CpaC